MAYSSRRFVVCLSMCHFVLVFFSPFSIAITSLGEERELILVLFVRLFDLCLFGFVLVWVCRFSLPLGVWEGLRFVIVALPGLFPYLFFCPTQGRHMLLLSYIVKEPSKVFFSEAIRPRVNILRM